MEKFSARNLGGLIHARTRAPGWLWNATSRTPSMYVDEKSNEAIVTCKGLTQGEQPLGGCGLDTEPKFRGGPNKSCASGDDSDYIVRRTTSADCPGSTAFAPRAATG